MSYWNPIMHRGPEEFAAALSEAGVSGAIVPDLTLEESDKWRKHAESYGVDTIFMVAPTTPAERIMKIASVSSGFLYLVSMTGVTGSSLNVSSRLEFQITNVKGMTNLPVSVGFGVTTPSQASELGKYADGVIVGSALVKRCIESQSDVEAINSVSSLSREISEALRFRN
jgi:tryptophan synthase alpha chain